MPCRIYKLNFQEKNLNLDRDLNHFFYLSIPSVDGKQHLSEVVISGE